MVKAQDSPAITKESSPNHNAASKIYKKADRIFDEGPTIRYSEYVNGYYYTGILYKTAYRPAGWLFRYEGYIYNTRMVPSSQPPAITVE